jgi:hypothetical protein
MGGRKARNACINDGEEISWKMNPWKIEKKVGG